MIDTQYNAWEPTCTPNYTNTLWWKLAVWVTEITTFSLLVSVSFENHYEMTGDVIRAPVLPNDTLVIIKNVVEKSIPFPEATPSQSAPASVPYFYYISSLDLRLLLYRFWNAKKLQKLKRQ